MSTMVHQRPHSPGTDLHPQFQHLGYHHDSGRYGQAFYDGHVSPFAHSSNPGSLYNSPSLMSNDMPPNVGHAFAPTGFSAEQPQYNDVQSPQTGLRIQYPGYDIGLSNNYSYASGPAYDYLPTGLESPVLPTESSSRRSRTGRSVARSSSPYAKDDTHRVSKSPKGKKTTKKASTVKTPRIDKPLSVLTKDMDNIPVRDMEEWVNRPADVRQKEVEKRNGYVTRPMNSFMLYRSAYAERTKQWCLQNNHQVVSAVSGESWPLEPKEVRDHYNELARQERDNHARAHPSYKFSPSKTATAARKKKSFSSSDDEEELSEPEHDPDGEWMPGRGGRSSHRAGIPRRQIQETFPAYSQNFAQHVPQQPQYMPGQQYTWDVTHGSHEIKPMAHSMPQQSSEFFGQIPAGLYRSPRSPMNPSMLSHSQSIEDVKPQTTVPPPNSFGNAGIVGFPGLISTSDGEFFQQLQQQLGAQVPQGEQVDPMLLNGFGGEKRHIPQSADDMQHEEPLFGMDQHEPGQFEQWMDAS